MLTTYTESLLNDLKRVKETYDKLQQCEKALWEKINQNEKTINRYIDENAALKEELQTVKIETERELILKLNSYKETSFVLDYILPKPIGKDEVTGDVVYGYNDHGVGYKPEHANWVLGNHQKLVNKVEFVHGTTSESEREIQYQTHFNKDFFTQKDKRKQTEEPSCYKNSPKYAYIPKSDVTSKGNPRCS